MVFEWCCPEGWMLSFTGLFSGYHFEAVVWWVQVAVVNREETMAEMLLEL